jgi:hypothetical protein
MKTLFPILIFFAIPFSIIAQEIQAIDSTRGTATIDYKTTENTVQFTPQTPALNQIAGAPKAFYSHYWEFGDGNYSKEENPKHTYKKAGEYETKLWATNNYDTGKPPVSRPKKVKIEKDATAYNEETSMTEGFTLQRNREPMPEEDIVVIMSYKNSKNYSTNGKLYLFYNEEKYNDANFELVDTRLHHSEKSVEEENTIVLSNQIDDNYSYYVSAEKQILQLRSKIQDTTDKKNLELTLAEAKVSYKKSSTLEFNDMKPNEERNVFYTFRTTPEMLKDTSAIISIRGVYVPDDTYRNHKVKTMEMEIVTSHDPNKMSSNSTFLNYRLVRFKRPKFKIKFQNNGEGPASTIRLETDIPDMFDKSTIRVEDMYPKCEICPKEKEVRYSCLDTTYTDKQAIFTFKNIYLPGSEQKNVKEYDSTKGFVKYSLKFAKDFHKVKTKSRTAIIFDKNEPIITNYSTTRFLPGISIGAKAGYNSFGDLENSKSYFIGATISPYKSYKWYWQVELLNSLHEYNGETTINEELTSVTATGEQQFQRTTTTSTFNNIDWEIPILARYNINNYIGLGAGLQGMISISEKQTQDVLIERFENVNMLPGILIDSNDSRTESKNSFTNLRTGFLVEATAGFARIGPSIGARYVFNFKENYNYMQFYAIWKF